MTSFISDEFLAWFKKAGGWYNEKLLDLKPFPGMGYGAVAIDVIPEDTTLFHIPDTLILSPYTSDLSKLLSEAEWETLSHGWCRLIMVMMYETERGDQSRWSGYLSNMPEEFDTPMMWNDEERSELEGTDIEDRIGKEDAEEEYKSYLLPVIQAHPELFPPSSSSHTLASFHLQGSRILSRSFTVPSSRFSDDISPPKDDSSDFSDDEDEQDEVAVMIPFADMLNAAFEKDNAHLYTDEELDIEGYTWEKGFTMKSTKTIDGNDQIYNTYSSPPNSELLRKYGHVDILPLSTELLDLLSEEEIRGWPFGNPADEVLLEGTLIVDAVEKVLGGKADDKWRKSNAKRVDWWLEEGQEDMFPLSFSPQFDDDLIAFIRLLLYDHEWLRAKKKGKLPTTVLDNDVASVIVEALSRRKSRYTGDINSDVEMIASVSVEHIPKPSAPTAVVSADNIAANSPSVDAKTLRKCYAAIVRLGEKRILHSALRIAQSHLPQKRKADADLSR
ncbi:uncharacterized protein IL334_000409 [Kwoniella shivajii]|uniref:Rubisco LSMT substrate-binding domain-containing protein n=1 Tax=Kwoniella shivajii TaxID=564305 RepID=A0ABZ1CP43_9TREE|nr:hypothetical protein IL334_000409 [Kwoniella shivajii]